MVNQSKLKDPHCWANWRSSRAVGTIETARNRKKMVRAINNAQGVEIIRNGKSVYLIGHFSSGSSSEMVLTLSEASNLLSSGVFKIPGVCGKVLIESKMVRIWFKPIMGADLICLGTQDFINKLRQIL